MKYYLTEITTYNNGTADAQGIYPFTDNDPAIAKDAAIAAFHSKMGGAMKNANYASELLVVMSGSGELVKRDYWVRPVPTPEPEPTPEIPEIPEEQA